MSTPKLAVQMFSVRDQFNEDPEKTLQAIADIGYAGVEFFGSYDHDPADLKKYLNNAGLQCCGWHTPFHLLQDDAIESTIAFNKVLENSYVVVPGLPDECKSSIAAWRETAGFFTGVAEKLAGVGMRTGFHNHNTEFNELDGEIPWHVLFENTPQEFIMQLDLGNALSGDTEVDLLAILKKFPARSETIHLKPYHVENGKEDRDRGYKALIGEDSVPWAEVFALCESNGTQWYIVEYESDAYPRLEAVERCYKVLKEMGK
ncbi:MAG: sugar phosphate isomerase/epimerase [Planctomycetes bacterium]|nr:sugar phosphate isomerase/epimerase [Planctomycetota bacterium]